MLETLCRQLRVGGTSLCPLAMTRPFMPTVNLAFEHVLAVNGGTIPAIPSRLVERHPSDGSTGTPVGGCLSSIRGTKLPCIRAHGLTMPHDLAAAKPVLIPS